MNECLKVSIITKYLLYPRWSQIILNLKLNSRTVLVDILTRMILWQNAIISSDTKSCKPDILIKVNIDINMRCQDMLNIYTYYAHREAQGISLYFVVNDLWWQNLNGFIISAFFHWSIELNRNSEYSHLYVWYWVKKRQQ